MNDSTPSQPEYGESWRDILSATPTAEPAAVGETPTATPPKRARGAVRAAGLAVAGLLAGVVGVSAMQAASGGTPTASTAGTISAPGGAAPGQGTAGGFNGGQPPGGFRGGPGPQGGGVDGEQRLMGTLTAVGSTSVSVKTSDGTSTYAVNAATDIERNGQPVALSALQIGDAVVVHLLPSGSGYVAERVLAGASSGPTGVQPPTTTTGRTT